MKPKGSVSAEPLESIAVLHTLFLRTCLNVILPFHV